MKKSNNKNLKIIFISIGITLCILISVLVVVYSLERKNSSTNVSTVIQQDISSIINNLGSKFIVQKQSEESGFTYDIYLEFKESIYVNGKSNERLYTNLMSQVISNLKTSVRFIDESQDLIIRATYDAEENKYYYTVNGEEDYFKKQDSINSLNKYEEKDDTDIRVNSKELDNIINNDWKSSSIDIEESKISFNDYDQYFETGINIRCIMSKVFNIVFTKRYDGKVINGITVGTNKEKIIEILGSPTFEENNIIGYKNKNFYVFFTDNEISVYRNEEYDTLEFTNLVNQYINNEINLKSFMNELTYLWDDYAEYDYNSNYIKIVYPLQGVNIYMSSYEDTMGIELYENFNMNDEIEKLIKNNFITGNLSNSLLLNFECERIRYRDELLYSAQMNRYKNNNPHEGLKEEKMSEKYLYVSKYNNDNEIICIRFLSLNDNLPDTELKANVFKLFWINDDSIIYSVKNKGIYYYNLSNKYIQELTSGNDEFDIKSYENGVIKYDDKIMEIEEE